MSAEKRSRLIYGGKSRGLIKAEPEFESKAVDHKPTFPGIDVPHISHNETGIDISPMFTMIVIPNKGVVIASKDSKISSELGEGEFTCNIDDAVGDALQTISPKYPEGYGHSKRTRPEIRRITSNGNGVIFEIGKKPRKKAS